MLASGDDVVLFQGVVTASQRVRAYNVTLAYDTIKQAILNAPGSTCECVAHLGPGCSHQMSMVLCMLLFSMLPDVAAMHLLPSHVAALQRVAMTINFAFGFGSVNRAPILSQLQLPRALSVEDSGMPALESAPTAARPREQPEPMCEYVLDVWETWRKASTKDSSRARIRDIEEDTQRVINEYPRDAQKQHEADLMRERLYDAYINRQVSGWDSDRPPLLLWYLVHMRAVRLERMKSFTPPPPKPVVIMRAGMRRCPACGFAFKGLRTLVCPSCDAPCAKRRAATTPAKTGKVQHILSLYDMLPGRWRVLPWAHGDGECLRVRNMGDEGMVGEYLHRLHEVGDHVQVKIRSNGAWRAAVVLHADLNFYKVTLRRGGSKEVRVARTSVRDCPGTQSNSLFRIQKCARSVTLVHGGRRRWVGRGAGGSGDHYQWQWNLAMKSTPTRLHWHGGGHGGAVEIVWVKDVDTRSLPPGLGLGLGLALSMSLYVCPCCVNAGPRAQWCTTCRMQLSYCHAKKTGEGRNIALAAMCCVTSWRRLSVPCLSRNADGPGHQAGFEMTMC